MSDVMLEIAARFALTAMEQEQLGDAYPARADYRSDAQHYRSRADECLCAVIAGARSSLAARALARVGLASQTTFLLTWVDAAKTYNTQKKTLAETMIDRIAAIAPHVAGRADTTDDDRAILAKWGVEHDV